MHTGLAWLGSLLLAAPLLARAEDPPFELQTIESTGRTVAAELVDLNGDGRTDLLQIAFLGIPPSEERLVRIYYQTSEGVLPAEPDRVWPLLPGSAAYDVADIGPEPGVELLLLHGRGLAIVSFAREGPRVRELPVPEAVTVAHAHDERGLDRLRLVWREFADEPWLLLPLPGELIALAPDGAVRARLDVGARVNYLIPPDPGPLFVESQIQVF